MAYTNVLVSGAGVSGTALAFWLARHGLAPTVVERASSARDGGYAVDIRGAAQRVIERMGLDAQIRSARTGTRGMSYVNWADEPVASMSAELLGGSGVVADLEVTRGDLTRILRDAAADTTEFLYGDAIGSLTDTPTGVEVGFEHGPTRSFELVIGADGLHSGVRALGFGAESEFVRQLGYYIAVFDVAGAAALDGWERYYNVPGRVAALYPSGTGDEAKAMLCFASPPLSVDRGDVGAQKELLARTFANDGWKLPALLDAMWATPDFYFDAVSQVTMKRWSSGRTALTGDAAYCASPLSGQGTTLALVGAYILAGELSAHDDHARAFDAYERRMRPYVERNQKLAKSNAMGLIPRKSWQIWFRNQNVRALPHLPWRERVTGGAQKAADAIQLAT